MTFGWRVHVAVPALDVELASDRLWVAGAIGIEEQGDDPVLLLAGFDDEVSARAAAAGERDALVEEVVDDSWADAWRAWARPVRVGEVLVQPAWLSLAEDHGAPVVITIDPGRAFGSGGHASTALALEALWGEPLDGAHVLDVGTGSGVLAIAAVRRGAAQVVGTDIDPAALAACAANAEANGVAARVLAVDEPPSSFATAFDAVLANLPGDVLRELARDLAAVVVEGGCLVLSGMIDAQLDGVVECFVDAGCAPRRVLQRDGWSAVVLDRAHEAAIDDDLLELEWYDTDDGGSGVDAW